MCFAVSGNIHEFFQIHLIVAIGFGVAVWIGDFFVVVSELDKQEVSFPDVVVNFGKAGFVNEALCASAVFCVILQVNAAL